MFDAGDVVVVLTMFGELPGRITNIDSHELRLLEASSVAQASHAGSGEWV